MKNTTQVSRLTEKSLTNLSSGSPLIDGMINYVGVNWNLSAIKNGVIYYTFQTGDIKNAPFDLIIKSSLSAFNSQQINSTKYALSEASSITGIKFIETNDTKKADLHFAYGDIKNQNASGLYQEALYSSKTASGVIKSYAGDGYIFLDSKEFKAQNQNISDNVFGKVTLLREIGHALGLKTNPSLSGEQNNNNNTIMSNKIVDGKINFHFQAYDKAALKWIYGGDGIGGKGHYFSSAKNHAPTINESKTIRILEDKSLVINQKLIGFKDQDSGDSMQYLQINKLPANGGIFLNNVSVKEGQLISTKEISSGKLVFKPDHNENGSNYASFSISASDGDSFSNPTKITVNVTPVMDRWAFTGTSKIDIVFGDRYDKGESDYINGGKGNDKIYGLGGSDVLIGGDGDDIISGGSGNDVAFGGSGNDLIIMGSGNEFIDSSFGGMANGSKSGSDTFKIESINGVLSIDGEDGVDTVDVSLLNKGILLERNAIGLEDRVYIYYASDKFNYNHSIKFLSIENFVGTKFSDTIYGGDEVNIIKPGDGADFVTGRRGGDIINVSEKNMSTDTISVEYGDSRIGGVDKISGFYSASTNSDAIDLPSDKISGDIISFDGIDSGIIHSHGISNGLISFSSGDIYSAESEINSGLSISEINTYLDNNIPDSESVLFHFGNDSYIFQNNPSGSNDILVDITNVSLTGLSNTQIPGDIWVI